MLPRILEPEVMDSAEEAIDYDEMDHSQVNRLFADDLLALCPAPAAGMTRQVLDVGTGTAQIPIEIGCRRADLKITAVDLAAHMLQLAQRNVIRENLSGQIKLEQVDAKGLPYPNATFDVVISNSIVHHIPEPRTVIREMVRVLRPKGTLFVRDLLRPPDIATLDRLVATYAGEANDHQRKMFRESLHAALTLDEARELLRDAGLPADRVTQTSDRHWTIASQQV
ncbi:MAG: methyltransferase domain-containing protein [Planctomycetia bacterium]|nr:methyltransferase domain-containing protein [Planctomycetia bacterium]